MISICVPTRGRPEAFKTLCLSALDNATNPEDIEFVIYREDDDDSIYEYVGNYKLIVGKRVSAHIKCNLCQKEATGPIYGFFSDDFTIETKGWDKRVTESFDACPDKILFVHLNDGKYGVSFGNIVFLHKNWVDTIGYVFPPSLLRGGDKWINDVAFYTKRRCYIEDVRIWHNKIENDATHLELVAEVMAVDTKGKYEGLKGDRYKDAGKLKDFINNFK